MKFMTSTGIGIVLMTIVNAQAAFAQDATTAQAEAASTQDIVVTGSRLISNGERAPTPVTVVSSDQLRNAAPSITEAVRALPQLTGSSSPSTATLTIGGGPSTLNSPNLRNLGANRTLTLLDGRRPPVSGGSGTVDTSVFPQLLIKRVDIVTGGASATYGSDAVSGVVNYIVDTSFQGLLGEVRSGISTYGDAGSLSAEIAGGTHFAGDAGRIVLSANVSGQNLVPGDARGYATEGWATLPNPLFGQPGQPNLLLRPNANLATGTFGGRITTPGALSGIQFDANGNPIPYIAGSPVSGGVQVGGDGARYFPTLVARSRQWSTYGHAEFDVAPDVTLFAEGTYGRSKTSYPNLLPFNLGTGGYVIRRDNAYLPASVGAMMDQAGITSFQLGKVDLNYGPNITRNDLKTMEAVAGIRAKLATDWDLDAYYSYGQSDLTFGADNNRVQAPSRLATDAVRLANGTIVCRSSIANPTNGCVPANPFGMQPLTDAQRAYLTSISQASSVTKQNVVSLAIRGKPFSLWAGPIGIAVGGEYRNLSLVQVADPIGQANGFTAANLKSSSGKFNVKEIFAELQVPLLADLPLAQALEFNGAVRRTNYSTSGSVTTWKVGLTDDLGSGFRLRAALSQDIRAPNIAELFGGIVRSVSNIRDYAFNGQAFPTVDTFTGSNPDLRPEVAKTLTIGGIYRPDFLPGFGFSIDYYRLKLKDAIQTLPVQTIVDQCGAGSALFCSLITRSPQTNQISSIDGAIQNVQTAKVSGIDLESNYTHALGGGDLSVRAITSYVQHYAFTTPGAGEIERAGTGVIPHWRGNLQMTYAVKGFTLSVQERYIGPVGRATPPVTIDDNRAPATFYTNATVRYRLEDSGRAQPELFLSISNLFNQEPRVGATNSCNLGICSAYSGELYDLIGRYFQVGVRIKM